MFLNTVGMGSRIDSSVNLVDVNAEDYIIIFCHVYNQLLSL